VNQNGRLNETEDDCSLTNKTPDWKRADLKTNEPSFAKQRRPRPAVYFIVLTSNKRHTSTHGDRTAAATNFTPPLVKGGGKMEAAPRLLVQEYFSL